MSVLLALFQFLKPYQMRVWIFLAALIFTAGVTLSIGQGLRLVIDPPLLPSVHPPQVYNKRGVD